MRSCLRTVIVLTLAGGLLALFLQNVDLRAVGAEILRARYGWLALSLSSMVVNLAIRSLRWQYLLEPLGRPSFLNAFRATAVGFAASTVFPARAGEVIRPYFLSRHEPVSATAAFATVILERLLDTVTVLVLLASFMFIFGRETASTNPVAFEAVKWAGASAGVVSLVGLLVLFVLAGNPERLGRATTRLERLIPSAFVSVVARIAEKFARGLGAIRKPGRLLVALAWSFPLWLAIAFGIWSVTVAFGFNVPYTGSFLLIAVLVIGVAVPTPGAVGGFHEAFLLGVTTFYGAPHAAAVGAAVVLHAFSIGPSLLLGLLFAAQEGLNVATVRRLAESGSGEPELSGGSGKSAAGGSHPASGELHAGAGRRGAPEGGRDPLQLNAESREP
jgi:glycosyltransferase 2 family protein